jgi:hypothetical protein
VQDWDRYAYARNNPVKYIDPSGHMPIDGPCGLKGEDCSHVGQSDKWHNDKSYVSKDVPELLNSADSTSYTLPSPNQVTQSDTLFDTSLPEPPNPSMGGIVAGGVVLTTGVVLSEILLTWAEVAIIPVVEAAPIIGVPMETVLISCSVTLIDIDIAYWSYAARVYQNPNEKQKFELLPPWGLGGD